MPAYSETSLARIGELHPDLAEIVLRVGEVWDCSVLCGYRGEAAQAEALRSGKSRAVWGMSPHNYRPALAVDLWPYPIDWLDLDRARTFAGWVVGFAAARGVDLTWGGDWYHELRTGDSRGRDMHRFDDLPHFQLARWKELRQ